jgi:hypothetical protein
VEIHENPHNFTQNIEKHQISKKWKDRTNGSCGAKRRAPTKAGLPLLMRFFSFSRF